MALPTIQGEFGVIDIDLQVSKNGGTWLKVRGISKDRVRDANGTWADGDPLFIDIIINQGAEHLFESVVKGDTILVTGRLKQRNWEKDGQKHSTMQIAADNVAVSVRWAPARTQRAAETSGIKAVKETLGGEVIQEKAPF